MLGRNNGPQLSNSGLSGDKLGKVPILGFESSNTPTQFVKLRFEPISSGFLRFCFALPNLRRLIIDRRSDTDVCGGQGANGGQSTKRPTGKAEKSHGGYSFGSCIYAVLFVPTHRT
jgi:hypothetical protein